MNNRLAKTLLASALSVSALSAPASAALEEGFEDVNTLAPNGWFFQNNSSPPPAATTATANWRQGDPNFFGYSGQDSNTSNSYIGTFGLDSTSAVSGGQISQWLLTPELQFAPDGTFSFYTRTQLGNDRSEYLDVRVSTNGASTNVGTGAGINLSNPGDFGTVLLSIGDAQETFPLSYPGSVPPTNTWYRFSSGTTTSLGSGFNSYTFANLPTSGTGRIAFRYAADNAGSDPEFLNGQLLDANNIGIDTVSTNLAVVPEPSAVLGTLLIGGLGIVSRRRMAKKNV